MMNLNLESISKNNHAFDANAYYEELSNVLGLKLIKKDFPENQKVYQQGDYLLTGEYKNYQVEIINRWLVKEYTEVMAHGFEYSIDKRMTIQSNLSGAWMILPKDSKQKGLKTGVEEFDQKFDFLGEKVVLSVDQLKAIARFDWIHLRLENQTLTFVDDYHSWYQNRYGPQAMIRAVHPIWKNSISNSAIKPESIKLFLDQLIDIIQK